MKTKYENPKLKEVAQKTMATLGSGGMAQAVKLPEGEDLNEWLAVNTVDFFNELNLIYGAVSQVCTKETCPAMTAAEGYTYLWQDSSKYTTPTELSAPEYVDNLMEWAELQINDETIFPMQEGEAFPKDFKKRVSNLFRRFFRVYAHIYHAHLDSVLELGADAHLNTCFKHFIFFVLEFDLIESKELTPLQSVIDSMLKRSAQRSGAACAE